MTTEPKKRDPFSDWRTAVGTRQYCGELELTIPIDRDNYFTITADPDTVAMVPVVLRQLLAQPEPEGEPSDQDVESAARLIYTAMRFERLESTPPWEDRGNSFAQGEARRCARSVLTHWGRPAIEPVPVPGAEGVTDEAIPQWSEGACGDGAAILRDGVMMPVEEVVASLNRAEILARATLAQPEPVASEVRASIVELQVGVELLDNEGLVVIASYLRRAIALLQRLSTSTN
jgi:hypothetical protein